MVAEHQSGARTALAAVDGDEVDAAALQKEPKVAEDRVVTQQGLLPLQQV